MLSGTAHTIEHHKFYNDRILLYKLASGKKPVEKKSYYFRFLNPSGTGYIRKSTKTYDLAEAKKIAFEHYQNCQVKKTLGIQDGGSRIQDLIRRFEGELSSNPATKQQRDHMIYGQIIPFFSKYPDLMNIADEDIWAYLRWRDETYEPTHFGKWNSISLTTIQMEFSILKFLFRRAYEKRLILTIPKFPSKSDILRRGGFNNFVDSEEKDKRGVWNNEQDKAIRAWQGSFRKRWNATIDKHRGKDIGNRQILKYHHRSTRYNWVCLYLMIKIVKSSGVRSYFLKRMTFDSIQLFKDNEGMEYTLIQVLRHQSKVRKRRECVANDMRELWDAWEQYKLEYEIFFGRKPQPKDIAFPLPIDWTRQREISRFFMKYVRYLDKELGLTVSRTTNEYGEEKTISLYSLRKQYISKALQNPKLNPYMVARQVGSSLKMLETHYDVNLGRVHRKAFTSAVRYLMELDKLREEKSD